MSQFHLPTKPLTIIDAINRRALATGNFHTAMQGSSADYNGHAIRVSFNSYRGYYVAEYQWGERVVIARGDCKHVLTQAIDCFKEQGNGASLFVHVNDADDLVAVELGLTLGAEMNLPWWTWKHDTINEALRGENQLGLPTISFLINATDRANYDEKIKNFIANNHKKAA